MVRVMDTFTKRRGDRIYNCKLLPNFKETGTIVSTTLSSGMRMSLGESGVKLGVVHARVLIGLSASSLRLLTSDQEVHHGSFGAGAQVLFGV